MLIVDSTITGPTLSDRTTIARLNIPQLSCRIISSRVSLPCCRTKYYYRLSYRCPHWASRSASELGVRYEGAPHPINQQAFRHSGPLEWLRVLFLGFWKVRLCDGCVLYG